jgi:dipeptidase
MKTGLKTAVALAGVVLVPLAGAFACTSIVVTRGASDDGSVMITYSCDGEFHPRLERSPAADHAPGDSVEITDWGGKLRGKVPQVAHTYAVVDLMNEHQLTIGETTTTGREELENPDGMLGYWDLMYLALQRARTAREAVDVMTGLADEYGYRSTGESFSIADPREAWIMEMIGTGEGGRGPVWVALRVPEGYISCYANQSRIGEFPLHDPDNCLYSKNVISFAVEKGYYDPSGGEPFRFCDAYDPPTPAHLKYCASRVWSILRRAAPSREFPPDYHRGVKGARPYPLWIKPDNKLSLADVMALMRDHYEGTPYDMTKGLEAGPFGNPIRWRPIDWQVDSVDYSWERSISTQQTGFSMVTQSRSNLPDEIGGVLWYGVDDTYTTCYAPLYCSIDSLPPSYTQGSIREFSWDSAWWIFNLVANYAGLRYSYMTPEILAVQQELEGHFISVQPAVEKTALDLAGKDPALMRRYLTDYSVSRAEMVVSRWQELGTHLITKYNDGYVKDAEGEPQQTGYPEEWLKDITGTYPDKFKLPPAE